MNNKATDTIKKQNMISAGDTITVGLSGGADSVALILFLKSIEKEYDLKLRACHINHCLRGKESDRDQFFCEKFCKELGVPIDVVAVDVKEYSKQSNLSIELAARILRYQAFAVSAKDGKIATAHTLSDSIETMLFNLGRGTGLGGLTGIQPKRDNIIRPLIDCTRKEIEAYLLERSVEFVTDSSNLSNDFSRNYIRNIIVVKLKELFPSLENTVGRTIHLLADDHAYLLEQTQKAIASIARADAYCVLAFRALHKAIRGRVLMELLKTRGHDYAWSRIALLENCIDNGSGVIQLSSEWDFCVDTDIFTFSHRQTIEKKEPLLINICKKSLSEDVESFLNSSVCICKNTQQYFKYDQNSNKKNTTFILDYDKIEKVFSIRTRKDGDTISIAGRGCTKTLKKLFNEHKIPVNVRNELLVFEDNKGIIAVERFGVDERCKVDENTKEIVVIKIS